jgi:type IV pilus assembly protein PilE
MKLKFRGVTVVELLVVLMIIAILAIIAIILYTAQVRSGRRTDAINSIYTVAMAEESYRTLNTTYGTLLQTNQVAASASGYYTIAVSNISATSYTLTATATGDQVNDAESGTSCKTLTYTMNLGAVTKTPAICWPA